MHKFKLIIFVLFISFFLAGCQKNVNKLIDSKKLTSFQNSEENEKKEIKDVNKIYDKLEVYYFHRTGRCSSCLAIGGYVNKTIIEYFSEEIKSEKIYYQEINIDLQKNKDLASKFQASGSSLFINAIDGENENIENIMEIWNLKNDENKFKSFLRNKINILLGL